MQRTQTNRFSSSLSPLAWVLLGLFILFGYLPLITQAGISVDDWGDISHNLSCSSFAACYQSWFPLFSNRPLAPLPIVVLTFALGNWYGGYLLINSLIYLAAIAICAKVIAHISHQGNAMIFALFAAIPIIAMPVITSPINQSTATVSFLLWSLSLASLWQFLQSGKTRYWLGAYVLLLLAFLTYEVILPLLVFTALLPWIANSQSHRPLSLRYLTQFILPMVVVLAIVTLWQKGIAPQFMEVDSRLKWMPGEAVIKLYTFLDCFSCIFPANSRSVFENARLSWLRRCDGRCLRINKLRSGDLGSCKTVCIPANYLGVKEQTLFIVSIFCFLSSASIFILSNESAVSGGYQARGLSSTWFAFAIALAAIFPTQRALRALWIGTLTIFFTLSALCFCIERNQTITAWQLQLRIVEDAHALIKAQQLPAGAVVMGDVPHYLTPNFNDEIVFSQPWDFGAALAIRTNGAIEPGPVIDSRRAELRNLRIENDRVLAQNFSGATLEQFWLYRFDPSQNMGSLTVLKMKNNLLMCSPNLIGNS
jgi:hypothetical protein